MLCVQPIKHENIIKGKAAGVGNSVMIVGSTTGRDGVGGASFASVELSETENKDQQFRQGTLS